MTLSGCSTTSSQPREPQFVTAECPPAPARLDRSFATPFPSCLDDLQNKRIEGGSWGEVVISLGERQRLRDVCLIQISKWVASEKEARNIESVPDGLGQGS